MTDDELWLEDMRINNWLMPFAPWWKRLPVIRHFRAAMLRNQVAQHDAFWLNTGLIPSGYDRWVIYGIARGYERTEAENV
jgi:hypothetical protein